MPWDCTILDLKNGRWSRLGMQSNLYCTGRSDGILRSRAFFESSWPIEVSGLLWVSELLDGSVRHQSSSGQPFLPALQSHRVRCLFHRNQLRNVQHPGSPISRTAQKVKEKCVKIIRQKDANVFLKNRHFRIGGWDYFAQERSNQKDKRSSQETGADYRKNAKKETLHWSS